MERKLYTVNDPISWLKKNISTFEKALVVFPSERLLESFMILHGKDEKEGYFFSQDVFPFEEIGTSPRIRSERISLLRTLSLNRLERVFGSLHGLTRKTIPLPLFREFTLECVKGNDLKFDENRLTQLGYSRTFNVKVPGEFSIKGLIIDVFVPGDVNPFRIETFDREIESIRTFDPVSQKSIERVERAYIFPATEGILTLESERLVRRRVESAESATGQKDESILDRLDTLDTLAGIFYEKQVVLTDYLKDFQVIFLKPDEAVEEYARRERETLELLADRPVRKFLYTRYGGVSPEVFLKLTDYTLVSNTPVTLLEYDSEISQTLETVKIKKREEEFIARVPLIDWTELEEGDLVVHKEYGVGRYLGVRTVENVLGMREYLLLQYRDNNKIYVPVDRVDRVHKYVGSDETIQLNSLKGNGWARQKGKVKKEVKALIGELSTLYGTREASPGIILPGEAELERDLAESFPYVETEDQQRALEEVLRDLQSDKAMDRLISGDAGYGKTEVAIRATFRSVVSGKQVAMLVPTTVLARQHYDTFQSRLGPLGVRVELLDRYRSQSERVRLLSRLKKGEVDVVVGTHSLLSGEVVFADLGLVVIDEEQLFGVLQKEHFKKLRLKVNVLSMSATPIPRTLYMSLSGLRDLSVISTPPTGRVVPETYIGVINDKLIRTAVLREANRGGQTIYVHNRVRELAELLEKLRGLLPEVKIDMAHGQMNKSTFERVVKSFYVGELELLLCTTIIESGVDVPNANTLIVDDSQRYGLAQLYQLRGRVGRSNRRAFSYFLYDPRKLTSLARERLKALKEFSGAGSGMKIALRDLEIRGFGTLLGAEQHGNINAVGLYLYREMVEKAMREVRGEQELDVRERSVDTELKNIPFDMVIPQEYVTDSIERLKIYRRIAACNEQAELQEIEIELKDRFGPLPPQVKSLLRAARIRLGAFKAGVKVVEYDSHLESINMLHSKDARIPTYLKGAKIVTNWREGKSVVYSIPERKLMKVLEELFLGVEKVVH